MINTTNTNSTHSNLEEAHQEQIKVLNMMLTETIDIASIDFLQMITALTKYEEEAAHEDVSNAVKELQHIDTLRQKLEHVIAFQQEVLNGENPYQEYCEEASIKSIIGPLLKLNYYQLIAAQDDLTKTVFKVQTLILKIKSQLTHAAHEVSKAAFTNLNRINDNFRNVTTTLSHLANEYYSSSDINLSEISDYFSDRYSMLSERIVLNWCVSSEYESIEEFKKYYSNRDKSESIELF